MKAIPFFFVIFFSATIAFTQNSTPTSAGVNIVADSEDVVVGEVLETSTLSMPPASLPLNSVATYKAYALSQICWAEIGYEMRNSVGNDYHWVMVGQGSVTELMDSVNRYVYTFDTSNADTEVITTTLFLLNEKSQSVFSGSSTDEVRTVNGKATFSPKIELRLSAWVPIELGEDASTLEIRMLNDWGHHTTVYNGEVYDGSIWISSSWIGSKFEYIVRMKDGNSYLYQNGQRVLPTEVTSSNSGFKINQFYEIKIGVNNDELVLPLSAADNPTQPVFKVTATVQDTLVQVDTYLRNKDGSYERPVRAHWFNVDSPEKVITVPVSLDGKIRVAFPYVGKYLMAIEYESLESATTAPDGRG